MNVGNKTSFCDRKGCGATMVFKECLSQFLGTFIILQYSYSKKKM